MHATKIRKLTNGPLAGGILSLPWRRWGCSMPLSAVVWWVRRSVRKMVSCDDIFVIFGVFVVVSILVEFWFWVYDRQKGWAM